MKKLTLICQQNLPFLLIAVILFLLAFLPFCMHGMSTDGTLYSSFAVNIAHHMSSTWNPFFTDTLWNHFYEHPPLAFYIQSIFIRILGDSIFVDKFYFFTMALTGLILILLYWRQLNPEVSLSFIWLPFICWLFIPSNLEQALDGNIEATLIIFTTSASYFALKSAIHEKYYFSYLLLSAIFITLSFFINGLQAFFPFSVPILYALTFRKKISNKAIRETFLLIGITLLLIGLLLLYPPIFYNTYHYLQHQVLGSLTSATASYSGLAHFHIFWLIFREISLDFLFLSLLFFLFAKKKSQHLFELIKHSFQNKWVWFFFFLALSASLPVIVSPRQSGRYIAQSFPFWSLFFIELLTPLCVQWVKSIKVNLKCYKIAIALGVGLLITTVLIAIYCAGGIYRHKPLIEDALLLKKMVAPHEKMGLDENFLPEPGCTTYDLKITLYRYDGIMFYPDLTRRYYIQNKDKTSYPAGYKPVSVVFNTFALLKKTTGS